MQWYTFIAWAAIFAQGLVLYHAVRNYRYALAKYERKKRKVCEPRVVVIIPCRGLDARFQTNITSFFKQTYDSYRLFFVVEDKADPAYTKLGEVKEAVGRESKASDTQILISGRSTSCSQKIHNVLYALERVPEDTDILAFADSDVCVRGDWLMRLVWPLRRGGRGAATGYRWFIPTVNNLPTLAMSAINAGVAQLLGNSRLNHAWGGSMAIRVEDFRRLDLERIWRGTLSDDLSLSHAVKKAGMKVIFVPGCLVPSFESTTWSGLYEFARRQFLITRVYVPRTWWTALLASFGSVAGLWGGLALAGYAAAIHAEHIVLYAAVPALFFAGQIFRAVLRQFAAMQILSEYSPQLWRAATADVLGCWIWSVLLFVYILSSAFGRTIRWRGIRYKLDGPAQTEVLGS